MQTKAELLGGGMSQTQSALGLGWRHTAAGERIRVKKKILSYPRGAVKSSPRPCRVSWEDSTTCKRDIIEKDSTMHTGLHLNQDQKPEISKVLSTSRLGLFWVGQAHGDRAFQPSWGQVSQGEQKLRVEQEHGEKPFSTPLPTLRTRNGGISSQ